MSWVLADPIFDSSLNLLKEVNPHMVIKNFASPLPVNLNSQGIDNQAPPYRLCSDKPDNKMSLLLMFRIPTFSSFFPLLSAAFFCQSLFHTSYIWHFPRLF